MLVFNNEKIIVECLWILSNICIDKNKDALKRIVMEEGLIEILFMLINSANEEIVKESIYCLVGICSTDEEGVIL